MAEVTSSSGLLNLKKTNLHVDDSGGDGRPVVLIHGWPLSGEAWEHQVGALGDAGYRVITYDRRGFGRSDKPSDGFDYDTLAEDLQAIIEELDLSDVTIVGFSMGGGEVARYVSKFGEDRLRSVVFAAAVPPYMLKSDDNPDGPLTEEAAEGMESGAKADRDAFFDEFTTGFFSAGEELTVSEEERQKAIALCRQSDQAAVLGCMEAFGTTDFRDDLTKISVPTLVIHGDSDGIVPFEGSGKRTHETVSGSELELIEGGSHGLNVGHAEQFNAALIGFLNR